MTSPNYPNRYPNNMDCNWVVTAPADHTVHLEADDFVLEDPTNTGYCYDYISVSVVR